ncbi:cleavage factor one Cft1 [Schizosaccharomyces cryophilus OY26]|uniref:Cleavage factor one Cft1 n=1 Tax=Schizosaccharomyces cryophilus (strain OY26 / ATCC MYA-4695 / CBS 11777 / NBRC 106824 / NRRL Y48691) TaxID=653667 RepID=S9WXI6_SCHCR|nr:cleavage factor one Cft1 [Schizosaccharomyces cryophilus OY26]EPY49387.1 cleavage factor one Cft1 [Schizosaccharomyces cryophilus OY26]
MSTIFQSLTDSTAVKNAVQGKLSSPSSNNLIVGKVDSLYVFEIEKVQKDESEASTQNDYTNNLIDDSQAFMETNMHLIRTHEHTSYVLRLVSQFQVFGTVTALSILEGKGNKGCDLLVMLTDYAKISILEWDMKTQSLVTTSLHYYEVVKPTMPCTNHSPTQLIVDPDSNCCLLRFHTDMMAIIPFPKLDDLEMEEATIDGPKSILNSITPYKPSFVLDSSQLESTIARILDVKFLHGYREPTLAILYSPQQTTTVTLPIVKDNVCFSLVTLDLDQGASAVITTIQNLPYDIFQLVPIPMPLGGSLLIGGNELIYVDSAGRTVGVGVNTFYPKCTNFPLQDQSNFNMELEGTMAVPLVNSKVENPFVLLILTSGQFFYVDFILDGKTVKGLSLQNLNLDLNDDFLRAGVTTALPIGENMIFLGSQVTDSYLVHWNRHSNLSKSTEDNENEDFYSTNDAEMEEMLDIYDTNDRNDTEGKVLFENGPLRISIFDVLLNIGPITDFAIGKAGSLAYYPQDNHGPLELVGTSGAGGAGGLVVFRRSIFPLVAGEFVFQGCEALWSVSLTGRQRRSRRRVQTSYMNMEPDAYLVLSVNDESFMFSAGETFDEVENSDFNKHSKTINVGSLMSGMRMVQICPTSIHVYDSTLKRTQLFNFGKNQVVVSTSICDPCIVIVFLGGDISLYRMDLRSQLLTRTDLHSQLSSVKTASLIAPGNSTIFSRLFRTLNDSERNQAGFNETSGIYGALNDDGQNENTQTKSVSEADANVVTEKNVSNLDQQLLEKHPILFALTAEGVLKVFNLIDFSILMECDVFDLPPTLCNGLKSETTYFNSESSQELVELLVADLGDDFKEPHLFLRSRMNEITVYKAFVFYDETLQRNLLSFAKVPQEGMTREYQVGGALPRDAGSTSYEKSTSSIDHSKMVAIERVGSRSAVFVTGSKPFYILSTKHSNAKFYPVTSESSILSIAPFNSEHTPHGYIYVDENSFIRICKFQDDFNYDSRWAYKKIQLDKQINGIAYHPTKMIYAVGSCVPSEFTVTDEDGNELYLLNDDKDYLPYANTGSLDLISPLTWTVIDSYGFLPYEIPLSVSVVNLEVSETTKLRKPYIAVGTSITKGEDVAVRGATYLFEVIDVVPQPGQPETRHKLKLVTREEIKGTVAVVCEVDGYLLSGQGQKIIIRALEDEDHLVGVAFIDLGSYTVTAKCLRNLLLFGDIRQSVSFVGFSEEPYRMTLFAKGQDAFSVTAADFLVQGENLYFVVADTKGNLRLLAYDPENPESHSGERLVTRGDFHIGHIITAMKIVPKEKKSRQDDYEYDTGNDFSCVMVNADGGLQMISPVSERVYRRLNIIQNYLANRVDSVGGLNPRSHRLISTASNLSNAAHRILDGTLIERFTYMSVAHRHEMAHKCGVPISTIMNDLVELDESLNYL